MARPMPSWKALEDVIAGEVVLSGSPAYKEWPKPFNARFNDVRPQAIVLCATPQDVSETIAFVRRHGLECATRSGGHCLAGRSVSRGVVIDVTPMHSVSVSGGVATVGAGARLGAVYESLQEQGLARGVPEPATGHAARSYSWIRPPRTSWRWICLAAGGPAMAWRSDHSGADRSRLRWGRWRL